MKHAELIVVKTTTIARPKATIVGPLGIWTETNFKAIIQEFFDNHLKGVAGYILVDFNNILWQCERDPVVPTKPYVRHSVKYSPIAKLFTSQQCWALTLYKSPLTF
jgi:hypothetical protein